jgi:hypothetical protein
MSLNRQAGKLLNKLPSGLAALPPEDIARLNRIMQVLLGAEEPGGQIFYKCSEYLNATSPAYGLAMSTNLE